MQVFLYIEIGTKNVILTLLGILLLRQVYIPFFHNYSLLHSITFLHIDLVMAGLTASLLETKPNQNKQINQQQQSNKTRSWSSVKCLNIFKHNA